MKNTNYIIMEGMVYTVDNTSEEYLGEYQDRSYSETTAVVNELNNNRFIEDYK